MFGSCDRVLYPLSWCCKHGVTVLLILPFGSLVLNTWGVQIRNLYTEIFRPQMFIYEHTYMHVDIWFTYVHIWTHIYELS